MAAAVALAEADPQAAGRSDRHSGDEDGQPDGPIGVGGVDSAETALTKIKAGADLVQLYTGLIYRGPNLPAEIVRGLSAAVKREGVTNIAALRDRDTKDWARRELSA